MAEINLSSLAELQGECSKCSHTLKKQARLYLRRRFRLAKLLGQEYQIFDTELKKFPIIRPKYQQYYAEFKHSFELFAVQTEQLFSLLERPTNLENDLAAPKAETILHWKDYRDDLQDALKDNARNIEQNEKYNFLAVLQILDTAERLEKFTVPVTDQHGKKNQHALENLKNLITQTKRLITKALHRRKVKIILLAPGDYPGVDTTRIVHREDNQISEDIVISQIVEKGYTRKAVILRKAAVIVKTRS